MSTKEFALHPLLTPINIQEYPPARVRQLWEQISRLTYAFDDSTRDNPEAFLEQFIMPANQFFEIGDLQGLVSISSMQPGVNASLHFVVWDYSLKITQLMAAAKSLVGVLFDGFGLNRLTAIIPEGNTQARRLATLLGFKQEGQLRGAFLSDGQYQNLVLYGLLHSEFDQTRSF